MAQAQDGDTVHVHYTGRLEDGHVFDSSEGGDPLSFVLGAGEVISGFEDAVRGLEPGATTTTTIPPEQGYGMPEADLVVDLPVAQLGGVEDLEVGQQIKLGLQDGSELLAVVTALTDDVVTIDANHHLAGKSLIFEIELVGIG